MPYRYVSHISSVFTWRVENQLGQLIPNDVIFEEFTHYSRLFCHHYSLITIIETKQSTMISG